MEAMAAVDVAAPTEERPIHGRDFDLQGTLSLPPLYVNSGGSPLF